MNTLEVTSEGSEADIPLKLNNAVNAEDVIDGKVSKDTIQKTTTFDLDTLANDVLEALKKREGNTDRSLSSLKKEVLTMFSSHTTKEQLFGLANTFGENVPSIKFNTPERRVAQASLGPSISVSKDTVTNVAIGSVVAIGGYYLLKSFFGKAKSTANSGMSFIKKAAIVGGIGLLAWFGLKNTEWGKGMLTSLGLAKTALEKKAELEAKAAEVRQKIAEAEKALALQRVKLTNAADDAKEEIQKQIASITERKSDLTNELSEIIAQKREAAIEAKDAVQNEVQEVKDSVATIADAQKQNAEALALTTLATIDSKADMAFHSKERLDANITTAVEKNTVARLLANPAIRSLPVSELYDALEGTEKQQQQNLQSLFINIVNREPTEAELKALHFIALVHGTDPDDTRTIAEHLDSNIVAKKFVEIQEAVENGELKMNWASIATEGFSMAKEELGDLLGNKDVFEKLKLQLGESVDPKDFIAYCAGRNIQTIPDLITMVNNEEDTILNNEQKTGYIRALQFIQSEITQTETEEHLKQYFHGENELWKSVQAQLHDNVGISDALQVWSFLQLAKNKNGVLPENVKDASPQGALMLQLKMLNLLAQNSDNHDKIDQMMSKILVMASNGEINLPPEAVEQIKLMSIIVTKEGMNWFQKQMERGGNFALNLGEDVYEEHPMYVAGGGLASILAMGATLKTWNRARRIYTIEGWSGWFKMSDAELVTKMHIPPSAIPEVRDVSRSLRAKRTRKWFLFNSTTNTPIRSRMSVTAAEAEIHDIIKNKYAAITQNELDAIAGNKVQFTTEGHSFFKRFATECSEGRLRRKGKLNAFSNLTSQFLQQKIDVNTMIEKARKSGLISAKVANDLRVDYGSSPMVKPANSSNSQNNTSNNASTNAAPTSPNAATQASSNATQTTPNATQASSNAPTTNSATNTSSPAPSNSVPNAAPSATTNSSPTAATAPSNTGIETQTISGNGMQTFNNTLALADARVQRLLNPDTGTSAPNGELQKRINENPELGRKIVEKISEYVKSGDTDGAIEIMGEINAEAGLEGSTPTKVFEKLEGKDMISRLSASAQTAVTTTPEDASAVESTDTDPSSETSALSETSVDETVQTDTATTVEAEPITRNAESINGEIDTIEERLDTLLDRRDALSEKTLTTLGAERRRIYSELNSVNSQILALETQWSALESELVQSNTQATIVETTSGQVIVDTTTTDLDTAEITDGSTSESEAVAENTNPDVGTIDTSTTEPKTIENRITEIENRLTEIDQSFNDSTDQNDFERLNREATHLEAELSNLEQELEASNRERLSVENESETEIDLSIEPEVETEIGTRMAYLNAKFYKPLDILAIEEKITRRKMQKATGSELTSLGKELEQNLEKRFTLTQEAQLAEARMNIPDTDRVRTAGEIDTIASRAGNIELNRRMQNNVRTEITTLDANIQAQLALLEDAQDMNNAETQNRINTRLGELNTQRVMANIRLRALAQREIRTLRFEVLKNRILSVLTRIGGRDSTEYDRDTVRLKSEIDQAQATLRDSDENGEGVLDTSNGPNNDAGPSSATVDTTSNGPGGADAEAATSSLDQLQNRAPNAQPAPEARDTTAPLVGVEDGLTQDTKLSVSGLQRGQSETSTDTNIDTSSNVKVGRR